MYYKKLIILVLLIILIFKFVNYYNNHLNQEVIFKFSDNLIPFVIVKNKNIEIYEEEIFYPINNLEIYSKSKSDVKYNVEDNLYELTILNEYGSYEIDFNFTYKPKEVIEIVKEVYAQKIINNDIDSNVNLDVDINYVEGIKNISLPLDSDIHDLTYFLTKDIKTSHQITIDYAEVNLSKIGKYNVYYYINDQKYHCYVDIY